MYVTSLAPSCGFTQNTHLTHFDNCTMQYHHYSVQTTPNHLPLDPTKFLFLFHWVLLFSSQWSIRANEAHLVLTKLSTSDLESQVARRRRAFAPLFPYTSVLLSVAMVFLQRGLNFSHVYSVFDVLVVSCSPNNALCDDHLSGRIYVQVRPCLTS